MTGVTTYEYDSRDNVIKTTDPNGNVQKYEYDKLNNLVSGMNTKYEYDAFSNLLKTTYPKGNTEENVYDEMSRVIKTTDSLGKVSKNYYNALGQLYKSTDRKGQITYYTYDERGRLTKTVTDDILNIIEYDNNNNVTKKTNNRGSQTYTYTQDGLLKTQTSEDGKKASYEYDKMGRRTKFTDYFGKVTTYGYNNRGNVSSVNAAGVISTYTYNPDGTMATRNVNNTPTVYSYDEQNRLTNLAVKEYTYEYAYDANGNVISEIARKGDVQNISLKYGMYSYDDLNRVTKDIELTGTTTYTYDLNGNIVTETLKGPNDNSSLNYSYDANNRLLQRKTADNSNIMDFGYDDNGNLICKMQTKKLQDTDDKEAKTKALGEKEEGLTQTAYYEYNAVNQLTKYQDLNGVKESFTYNVNGLRDSKSYSGNTKEFYYDGDNVADETKNGAIDAINYYGADGQIERRENYLGGPITSNPRPGFYITDGHGDTRVIYEGTQVFAAYEYDTYGKEKSATGTFDNPYRYTGQYYDSENGMYYLRARYYDPDIRRFISEDTHWNTGNCIYGDTSYKEDEIRYPSSAAMTQSGNLYGYALNNPLRYYDPIGNNAGDILFGVTQALDENNFGGAVGWVANKFGKGSRDIDFEYDYYLGRVIGDALSALYGIGVSASGICEIIGSIAAGGAVTVGSGGTLAVGGVSISVAGAVAGTATATYGGTVVMMSAGKFGSDVGKMQQAGMNNKRVMNETKIKGHKVSMDLEKGGSGRNNIHVKVDGKKYFFNANKRAFLDSAGHRLPKVLRGNQQIIDALGKATELISQGW